MAQPRKTGVRKARPLMTMGSRQGFALPALYDQLQPVLSTSPRSYMLAGATTAIESPAAASSMTPVPPLRSISPLPPAAHRSKARDQGSPRVMRAQQQQQPPSLAAARVDVDLYRYHHATEQRMAIRPLFEERHEERAARASQMLLQDPTHHFVDDDAEKRDGESDCSESEEEEFTRIAFVPPLRSVESTDKHEADTDDGGELPLDTSVVLQEPDVPTTIEDHRDSHDDQTHAVGMIENENIEPNTEAHHKDPKDKSDPSEADEGPGDLLPSSSLFAIKPLDESNYHEPFLPVEAPPSVGWLKRAVDQSTRNRLKQTTEQHPNQDKLLHPAQNVFYKTLWKEMRAFASSNVLLTVLLGSDMSAHVAIEDQNDASSSCGGRLHANSNIPITETDVQASKHARTDLCVFTPKWAEWIISRVKQDDNGSLYLQFDEHHFTDNRICFSRVMVINGEDIHVRMLLLGTSDLLVRAHRVGSEKAYEIVIRATELFRIAVRLDEISAEELEESSGDHLRSLLHDQDFLAQVVQEGKILQLVMRLGVKIGENQTQSESSANMNGYDATAQSNNEQIELKDQADACISGNPINNTISFLSQAYTDYGILSALRWFQQKNAVASYVYDCVNQPLSLNVENQLNREVQAMIETAKQAKLMVNCDLCSNRIISANVCVLSCIGNGESVHYR